MSDVVNFAEGGYSFIPAAPQYSAGVCAAPGLSIDRVRFTTPVPLSDAFEKMAGVIKGAGRPLSALCGCELRSPAPFTESGFVEFSRVYLGNLEAWGLLGGGMVPVARSNVCPKFNPPREPSVYAFSYTVIAQTAPPSFVIAGSCEVPEGKPSYKDHIVRYDDVSADAIAEKAEWVLNEMERRLGLFVADWTMTTAAQIYTVHNAYPVIEHHMARRGILKDGITWHLNRPPVVGLEFEMDCRRVYAERVIEV